MTKTALTYCHVDHIFIRENAFGNVICKLQNGNHCVQTCLLSDQCDIHCCGRLSKHFRKLMITNCKLKEMTSVRMAVVVWVHVYSQPAGTNSCIISTDSYVFGLRQSNARKLITKLIRRWKIHCNVLKKSYVCIFVPCLAWMNSSD